MSKEVTVQGGTKNGTSGDDSLYTLVITYNEKTDVRTYTYYKRLNGKAGDDHLYNGASVSPVTLDGGAGNDSIENKRGGHKALILGGKGNDDIRDGEYNHGNNYVTIDGGANSDYIYHYGKKASIDGGTGNDSIYSYQGYYATIIGDKGNDYISNEGKKSTLTGGAGHDTIYGYGDNLSITGDAGNDVITGYGSKLTIRGGKGNDSLTGSGDNSDSLAANVLLDDTIGTNYFRLSYSSKSSILSGAGNDSVSTEVNDKALVKLGEGNNSLNSRNDKNSTILAGAGNDSLVFYNATNLSVNAGNGDNVIDFGDLSYSINSTKNKILAGKGNDTVINHSNSVSISTGAGDDSIKHVGANSTIRGGSGNDWINNDDGERDYGHNNSISSYNFIDGGSGNDTLDNACDNVTLSGGSGNDYLSSGGTDSVSIDGGKGNDTIYNTTDINIQLSTNSTLNGGAGNDYIFNTGNNVTIDGGKGNDTIYLGTALAGRRPARYEVGGENVLITYNYGDGNDLIQGFDSKATLSIGGDTYSTKKSGENVIVTVGKGKITLDGAASINNLNIVGSGTTDTFIPNSDFNVEIKGSNNAEHFENKGYFVTIQALGGNDTIYNYGGDVSIDGGAGDDSIIHNDNVNNMTISGGKGNDYILVGDNALIKYAVGDGSDYVFGFNETATLSIGGSFYSTEKSGSDIIVTVSDGKITLDGAATSDNVNITGNFLALDNAYAKKVTLDANIEVADASARTKAIKIVGNSLDNSILGGKGNDCIKGGSGNDTLIGGAGNDSLWGDAGNDTFIYSSGDGKDIIYGFEDGDTLRLDNLDFTPHYNKSTGVVKLTFDSGSIMFKEFTATTFHINNDIYQINSKNKFVKQ